jgi:sugar (pentulose or hexulose) kinase
MLIYAVDLGTTNLKVALYDESLRRLALSSKAVSYDTRDDRVEFDPRAILADVIELIGQCAADSGIETRPHRAVIVLTGQAESVVLAGADLAPVRPGISWLDSRASRESAEIEAEFTAGEGFRITGQPFPAAAWPASKLRWLARHEPRSMDAARHVLMIKDYVQLSLTGVAAGESSTRAFSYFYDVAADAYWPAMLEFCGVEPAKLPPIIAPGATVGPVSASVGAALPPAAGYTVNAGTLDHFASMAGAGSYSDSVVSESSGTVLSLSFIAPDWKFDPSVLVSFHRGLRRQDTVCFDCADSGGMCLEWFKNNFYGSESYDWLESRLADRVHGPHAPLFLPYLTGLNPPEYFKEAAGAFLELTLRHDGIDMAYAVMEGVAHLLRSNIDYCEEHLLGEVQGIVSTGGGSASAFWSQLKADACGRTIVVPIETQSVCRGAAVIGLVEAGILAGIGEAESLAPVSTKVYTPSRGAMHRARYERFQQLRDLLYATRATGKEG